MAPSTLTHAETRLTDELALSGRISTRIVQLQKEHFGKGPTKAKTYIADDLISVVLQGGFTVAEKMLVSHGRREVVMRQRSSFQQVMSSRFIGAIEELTGRRVAAYLSATEESQELSVETFVLEPSIAAHVER